MSEDRAQGKIACRCTNGLVGEGSYEVVDGTLVLTSSFGTHKAVVGLQAPGKLASTMLRNICAKAAKRPAAVAGP